MVRIVLLIVAVGLIVWQVRRVNKKVLCAKSFIFIKEMRKRVSLSKAVYLANLFDFFDKKRANAVFDDMEKMLKKEYNNDKSKLIFRAETLGFIDTHTRQIFKKKKRVIKILERAFLSKDPADFEGNSTEEAKRIVVKYWDKDALNLAILDDRTCALSLIFDAYEEAKNSLYTAIAVIVATSIKDDAPPLGDKDWEIVEKWNKIIKGKSK